MAGSCVRSIALRSAMVVVELESFSGCLSPEMSGERNSLVSQCFGHHTGDLLGTGRLEVGVVVAEEGADRAFGVVAVVRTEFERVVQRVAQFVKIDDRHLAGLPGVRCLG